VTRFLLALPFLATIGCNSSDSGTIQLITDEEAGTFTQKPIPTELQIVGVESPDASSVLATAKLPASTIDLGQLSESAPAVSFNVAGLDSTGTRQVFGASLPVQYAALNGVTLPIFVQRTGELARLPGTMPDSRQAPALAVLQGEYLLIAGGNDSSVATTGQLFDFGPFAPAGQATFPMTPQSIAVTSTVAWLIDGTQGMYFDFGDNCGSSTFTLPAGGTFADIAGGATVVDDTGAAYVVGATRVSPQPASALVLKITPSDSCPYGTPTWLTLTVKRLGAAATWVSGTGLVVAGGNGASSAAGVEFIGPNSLTGMSLPFSADSTAGAGAAALDAQHVILAGGVTAANADPGVRVIDIGCASPSPSPSCTKTWAALPKVLGSAQAFGWSPSDALVVGNDSSGQTHAFRLTATSATEVATRTAHVNARAVWSPVGSVVLFGGANVIESFTP
jgi:hypothetical protein